MARDEYHLTKGPTTIPGQYFRAAQTAHVPKGQERAGRVEAPEHKGNPFRIAISGTPFEGSIKDLVGHLQSIEAPEWSSLQSRYHNCTEARLKDLEQQFNQIMSQFASEGRAESADLRQILTSYSLQLSSFLSPLMIRRTGSDLFFDYHIIDLPKMEVIPIVCKTSHEYLLSNEALARRTQVEVENEFRLRHRNWVARGSKGPAPKMTMRSAKSSSLFYLRLAGDFAAIPLLWEKNLGWAFKAAEVYDLDWDKLPRDSLYVQHFDTLWKSSTKIDKLDELIEEMVGRTWEARQKNEPMEKMLLTTLHPAVLLILYAYLKESTTVKICYINANMT